MIATMEEKLLDPREKTSEKILRNLQIDSHRENNKLEDQTQGTQIAKKTLDEWKSFHEQNQ